MALVKVEYHPVYGKTFADVTISVFPLKLIKIMHAVTILKKWESANMKMEWLKVPENLKLCKKVRERREKLERYISFSMCSIFMEKDIEYVEKKV